MICALTFQNDALLDLCGPPRQEPVCSGFHCTVLSLIPLSLQQSPLCRSCSPCHIQLHSQGARLDFDFVLVFPSPFYPLPVPPPAELWLQEHYENCMEWLAGRCLEKHKAAICRSHPRGWVEVAIEAVEMPALFSAEAHVIFLLKNIP